MMLFKPNQLRQVAPPTLSPVSSLDVRGGGDVTSSNTYIITV